MSFGDCLKSRTARFVHNRDSNKVRLHAETQGFCDGLGCRGTTMILVWESSFLGEDPRVIREFPSGVVE